MGWFFFGLFFSILALIIICCLSDLNAEQAKHAAHANEQRRLREQLRQERMKAEAFRKLADSRLAAHDNALGMDTRPLGSEEPPPHLGPSPEHDRA